MSARARIDGIDFWRGIALLTIFINHVPDNIFSYVTHKNFGFSDAAEAFVFLSGISVALAYGSYFLRGDTGSGIVAVLRRVFTLYWVQILISFLVVAIFALAAYLFGDHELVEDPDREAVVSHPARAFIGILGLSHQLDFINILPLYMVLLLAAPILLLLGRSSKWLMLGASVTLYAVARKLGVNLPTWPVEGSWFFNPFAWQLLFVAGLFIGLQLKANNSKAGPSFDGRLFAGGLLLLVASSFVVTNGFGLFRGLWDSVREILDLNKTDLGLLRFAHFLALAYVIRYSGLTELLRPTRIYQPVALMGRYSLPVFATGSVLCSIAQMIEQIMPENATPSAEDLAVRFVIVVTGVLIHYLVARWMEYRAVARKVAVARKAPAPAPARSAPPTRPVEAPAGAAVAPAR